MNHASSTEYLDDFVDALMSRSPDAHPPELSGAAARRFRIYRNNVHGALITALADAYPVCQRLVGEDFFAAMAREFFLGETSRQPSLAFYGRGFAEFIERFAPAQSVPYLADVARLERSRLESVHSADASVLQASDLPSDGEKLLKARLEIHPAVRVLQSGYPVFTIWHANQPGQSGAHSAAGNEQILITRPGDSINLILLNESALLFLGALIAGETIQAAYESVIDNYEDFDVVSCLSHLLGAGCFSRLAS